MVLSRSTSEKFKENRELSVTREAIAYRLDQLHIEDVCVKNMVEHVQTPVYCYSANVIREKYETLSAALSPLGASICFAMKANGNLSVLGLLAELGCGMDIVSGGELQRALVAGVPASRIIFSGVGKTKAEIARALEVGIHQINVESASEIEVIAQVARTGGWRAPIALRVNPDVDAKTHAKITTGRRDSKFGIPMDEVPALYAKALAMPELQVCGLAVHIGSQIKELSPFRHAYTAMANLVRQLRAAGHVVASLDLGGGIGVESGDGTGPDLSELAAIIRETVGDLGCALTVEPGRWLVAQSGLLITEILYLKQMSENEIVIVDAAMNDLMRPALYDAVHPVLPVHPPRGGSASTRHRLVGPICESSDVFGTYEGLGELREGDLLAFNCAGAYCASMASTYNSRDLVAEVLIDGDQFRVIRKRQTIDAMLKLEEPGAWQTSTMHR